MFWEGLQQHRKLLPAVDGLRMCHPKDANLAVYHPIAMAQEGGSMRFRPGREERRGR